jgi:excinuclease ABC subunit C
VREGDCPDLLVVDGGKGQLRAAVRALEERGVEKISVAAIAKKKDAATGGTPDRAFVPGRKNPIPLREGDRASLFLRRMRDEAHRFAIAFHRGSRRRRLVRSELTRIAGIGDRRARALLRRFGGTGSIAVAPIEELAALLGSEALARRVHAELERARAGEEGPDRTARRRPPR